MNTERTQPGQQSAAGASAPASVESFNQQAEGSPEYDALLRKFGQAMLRISQLESQLSELGRGQQQGSTGFTGESRAISNSQPETGCLADVAQLRLQITSLANQLAQTQEELKRVQGTRVRRRSHGKHHDRPKWKLWGGSRRR